MKEINLPTLEKQNIINGKIDDIASKVSVISNEAYNFDDYVLLEGTTVVSELSKNVTPSPFISGTYTLVEGEGIINSFALRITAGTGKVVSGSFVKLLVDDTVIFETSLKNSNLQRNVFSVAQNPNQVDSTTLLSKVIEFTTTDTYSFTLPRTIPFSKSVKLVYNMSAKSTNSTSNVSASLMHTFYLGLK